MAIEYAFYVRGVSVQKVYETVLAIDGFSKSPESHRVKADGLSFSILTPDPEDSESNLWKKCEDDPGVLIFFRYSKLKGWSEVSKTMVLVIQKVLEISSGDALFYYTQGDQALLHRYQGKIFLDNTPDGFWLYDPSILERFTLGYTLDKLPEY